MPIDAIGQGAAVRHIQRPQAAPAVQAGAASEGAHRSRTDTVQISDAAKALFENAQAADRQRAHPAAEQGAGQGRSGATA